MCIIFYPSSDLEGTLGSGKKCGLPLGNSMVQRQFLIVPYLSVEKKLCES